MKPMFEPENCPKCDKTTVVEHYDTGWRCICDCGWYGIFHFDKPIQKRTIKTPPKPRPTSLKLIKEAVKKAPPNRSIS
jgi:hypothetical protein